MRGGDHLDGQEVRLAVHGDGGCVARGVHRGIGTVGRIANVRTLHRGSQRIGEATALLLEADNGRLGHAVVAALGIEAGILRGEAAEEIIVVAQACGRPPHLGQRNQARIDKVLNVLLGAVFVERAQLLQGAAMDELVAPKAGLHAKDGGSR